MSVKMSSGQHEITYKEWKEKNNKPKKVMAIATTAGAGGVRLYDEFLDPPKKQKKQKSHHDVVEKNEPQHDNLVLFTNKVMCLLPWRTNSSSDSEDEEQYFKVGNPP